MNVRLKLTALALAVPVAGALAATALARFADLDIAHASVERGRYLVRIGGCNDCHTRGYMERNGVVPESDWLAGDALGWQGGWGTSYAPNLRLFVRTIDEDGFVHMARTRDFLPPMPSPSLRSLTEQDLRSIYRYTVSLGPTGAPAPAWVPPGQPVGGPVVRFPSPAA